MILKYNKNNSWEILAPNTKSLFTDLMKSETNKKYLTIKECAKILYSLTQSVVTWNEDEYIAFIKTLKKDTMNYYMTKSSNSKGTHFSITRENTNTIKNDLDYLWKLFSIIVPLMILDRKNKLFVEI